MKSLRIKIKRKLFYRTGKPVEVQVIIKNPSKQDYYLKIAKTPFEKVETDCFEIVKAGKKIAYDGAYIKRKKSKKEYMLLPAGAVRIFVYDLAKLYDLNEPGKYTIRLKPEVIHSYTFKDNKKRSQIILSPQKSFYMRRGEDLSITNGERERITEQFNQNRLRADWTASNPIIIDNNPNDNNEQKQKFNKLVREAHTQMLIYLKHSVNELSIIKSTDCSEHYQMTFGKYRKENAERALEVASTVQKAMQNSNISFVYMRNADPKYEELDIYGYTYPGTRTVYLCPAFLTAKFSGEDSRMGTLFHEWTHAVGNTDDVKYNGEEMYGREDCCILAREDEKIANIDERAVNNADSYEFFLETQFLNWGKETIWEGCNDLDKKVSGGPAVVYYEKNLLVFYKNEEGKIKCAMSTKEGCNESRILTDKKGVAFESASQPEIVVFKGKLYLFYIKKDGLRLFYTKRIGNEWMEEIPVLENGKALYLEYPPQPVVFKDSIYLIYQKSYDMQFYVMSGSGEVDGWSKERQLENQTGLVQIPTGHPAVAVYNEKLYIFYQIQSLEEDEKNQIFCGIYDNIMDVWKKRKISELSDLNLKTTDEMRAVVVGDSVYLVVRNTGGELVQIRMNIPLEGNKELFFTDGEEIYNNTLYMNIPNSSSRCSIVGADNEKYLFYFSSLENEIVYSAQKSGSWESSELIPI